MDVHALRPLRTHLSLLYEYIHTYLSGKTLVPHNKHLKAEHNDAQTDSRVAGGNSRFLLGCVGWLTDTDTTATLVAAKGLTSDALTFTAGQTVRYGTLAVLVLPLALLVCGAVITLKRRAR